LTSGGFRIVSDTLVVFCSHNKSNWIHKHDRKWIKVKKYIRKCNTIVHNFTTTGNVSQLEYEVSLNIVILCIEIK